MNKQEQKQMEAVIKGFENTFKKSNNPEDLRTLLNLSLAFMQEKGYALEFGAYLAGFAAKVTALQQEPPQKKRFWQRY